MSDIPLPPEPQDDPFPVSDTGSGKRETRVDRGARLYFDVAGLLSGGLPKPPRPTILTRNDTHALFYTSHVNSLFGSPECGKTMLAKAAISEVAKAWQRAVFIDIDHNGPDAIVSGLLAMGVTEQYLVNPGSFRYYEPEDKQELLDLVAFLKETFKPALVVVDSVGELLPLFGLNSNSPDDFTSVHTQALKPLAAAGAAVVIIDHLAKNTDSAASGPTGTAAKRRAVSGVSIRVKVNEQFVPGYGGSAWLTVNKDRHGGLRAHCPRGERKPSAGLFVLTANGDSLSWDIKAPTVTDAEQILGVAQEDLDALAALDPAPATVRDVQSRLHWGAQRATDALRVFRARVSAKQPGNEKHDGDEERFPLPDTTVRNGKHSRLKIVKVAGEVVA